MNENEIRTLVLEHAIQIHRELGPSLLESVYEEVLAYKLRKAGVRAERQVPIPIHYEELYIPDAFKADIVVNDLVILELKSVEQMTAAHRKQIQTYLRLADKRLGYLLNFGAALMRDGIVRAVNNLPESNQISLQA
jgi:GxxExxY protein